MGAVFVFGRDDPARTRFAVSPLWETNSALRVLLEPWRHRYHLPWLDSVRPDLGKLDLRALLALSPRSGWAPDFLNPVPAGPGTTIADQLAQVRATPPEQVAAEVERSLTERDVPAPDAAWRLLDDPAATRAMLADLLEHCWQLLMAPHWPRLRDLLDADLAFRTQTLADYGLERVLGDLHPKARWTGRAIVIDHTPTARRHLRGSGLLLIPSVFAWPDVCAVTDPPARPTLIYPARGSLSCGSLPARRIRTRSPACWARPGPGCWSHSPNRHPLTPSPDGTASRPAPYPSTWPRCTTPAWSPADGTGTPSCTSTARSGLSWPASTHLVPTPTCPPNPAPPALPGQYRW